MSTVMDFGSGFWLFTQKEFLDWKRVITFWLD